MFKRSNRFRRQYREGTSKFCAGHYAVRPLLATITICTCTAMIIPVRCASAGMPISRWRLVCRGACRPGAGSRGAAARWWGPGQVGVLVATSGAAAESPLLCPLPLAGALHVVK